MSKRTAAVAATGLAVAFTAVALLAAHASTPTGSIDISDRQSVSVNQTTVVAPMHPGDTPQALAGTFDNPAARSVFVISVTATIESVTLAGGAVGTCDPTDFALVDGPMAVGQAVPPGTSVGSWAGATIQFNNKADVNQDACKGATVHLAYAVSVLPTD
jgi:hypothetical protein